MTKVRNRIDRIEKAVSQPDEDRIVAISYPYGMNSTKALERFLLEHPQHEKAKIFVMCANFADYEELSENSLYHKYQG